ncbi:mandelate racemase/muconate lactonizing enzyme family protein [Hwanghaeella sp.]|uniref:mandelate racemase/muconate lactonizing enzyme family protein n=1 Tax=Hwanghaeella sp. TaxID=2605943 RepID=UPI003CCB7593
MRVSGLSTAIVDVPLPKPIRSAIHVIKSATCVLVTVETDEGVSGEGLAFTINGARIKSIDAMIQDLEPMILGRDPHDTAGLWQQMWDALNFVGQKGVPIIAMSAIDTALWDIVGKAAGKPLHKLFGAARDKVPAYASGGLWMSLSLDELQQEARDFLSQGHTAMKVRVGKGPVAAQVERVEAVRDVIGYDIRLMADANQSLTAKEAIRLGRELERFDLTWFEEPVPCWDFEGHAEIRAALDTPLASGETEYTRYGMRQMIETKACDILMPDLERIGGFTEFRRSAALAAAFDIPVTPHLFTEYSLCLAGSLPNCFIVEHMPWFAPIYRESIQVKDGEIEIPDRPGHGFTFDPDAVDRFRV